MAAFARSQRRLLRAGGTLLQLKCVMEVTYAGSAISASLPLGGPEIATAFAYRQYHRSGIDAATTAWALAVSGIMSSLSFAIVLAGGAIVSQNSTEAALGLSGAAIAVAPTVIVLAALRSRRVRGGLNRLLHRSTAFARRLFNRPKTESEVTLERLLEGLAALRLPRLQYAEAFALALWNWVADALCLAAALSATGTHVPWRGLFLAYALGKTAGSTGLTPGGLGIIEPVLASALVASHVSARNALAAVLLYRLISFWLVIAAGWAMTALLTRNAPALAATTPLDSKE